MVRVLVVEDEANIRDMIALNLRHAGMEVVEAESAEAALPLLAQKPGCDAAILDVMLPGMNGFSLCETALVREKILKGVWGENYFGDVKIVDVNIRRLRMKVEDEPSHPTHIMTVWGYGYRWEE